MKIQSLSPVFQNKTAMKNFGAKTNPYIDLTSKGDTVTFSGHKKTKKSANIFADNIDTDFAEDKDISKIFKKADKLLKLGEQAWRKANSDNLDAATLTQNTKKGTNTFKYRNTGSLYEASATKITKDDTEVTETFSYDFEGKLFQYTKKEVCPDGEIKTRSIAFDEDGEPI